MFNCNKVLALYLPECVGQPLPLGALVIDIGQADLHHGGVAEPALVTGRHHLHISNIESFSVYGVKFQRDRVKDGGVATPALLEQCIV